MGKILDKLDDIESTIKDALKVIDDVERKLYDSGDFSDESNKLDDCYYNLEKIFDDISEIREMIDSLF